MKSYLSAAASVAGTFLTRPEIKFAIIGSVTQEYSLQPARMN
jgi:hypothetical protein